MAIWTSGLSTSKLGPPWMLPARTTPSPFASIRALAFEALVQFEAHVLQVEHDVGHVFSHARQRSELVQHTIDFERGDRRTL